MDSGRRCSNYILILDSIPGLNGLGKDHCKTRRESFKLWDLVPYIRGFWYMLKFCCHGPLTKYGKLRVAHEPEIPGKFSPPPRVSDPDMHHGTCVTHVRWCMPGSLVRGFLGSWLWGKRSRHSRRMRNPQFYVIGKRPVVHCSSCFHLISTCVVISAWYRFGCYSFVFTIWDVVSVSAASILRWIMMGKTSN